MQRIYACALSVEDYVGRNAHEHVVSQPVCAFCGERAAQYRHGSYERSVISRTGLLHAIKVARFLCAACGHTISYLPSFALSYRLLQAATFEAFLAGRWAGRDVQTRLELLHRYRRRMEAYRASLTRAIGYGFGRAPPQGCEPCAGVWAWLREACGSMESATCRLVSEFKITVFNRYQCHQPNRGVSHHD
ncbi:MAG: DUF6431 domain-containing protein [Opitutaceae bacterium]|jgi:hypothetical protein